MGLSKRVVYFLHIKSVKVGGAGQVNVVAPISVRSIPFQPLAMPHADLCLRVTQSCSIPASMVRVGE